MKYLTHSFDIVRLWHMQLCRRRPKLRYKLQIDTMVNQFQWNRECVLFDRKYTLPFAKLITRMCDRVMQKWVIINILWVYRLVFGAQLNHKAPTNSTAINTSNKKRFVFTIRSLLSAISRNKKTQRSNAQRLFDFAHCKWNIYTYLFLFGHENHSERNVSIIRFCSFV